MAQRAKLEVQGLDKTLRAVRKIDREAIKSLKSGFKKATLPVVKEAKSRVPRPGPFSNYGQWTSSSNDRDLSFNTASAKRGIKSEVTMKRKGAGMRLISKDPAAAIWENAGSKFSYKTTRSDRHGQARAFMVQANRMAPPPRLLVGAWKDLKGIRLTYTEVGRLIADLQDRLDREMRS